jgi:hypothetical protein
MHRFLGRSREFSKSKSCAHGVFPSYFWIYYALHLSKGRPRERLHSYSLWPMGACLRALQTLPQAKTLTMKDPLQRVFFYLSHRPFHRHRRIYPNQMQLRYGDATSSSWQALSLPSVSMMFFRRAE